MDLVEVDSVLCLANGQVNFLEKYLEEIQIRLLDIYVGESQK